MSKGGTRHAPEWYLPEIRQYIEKNGPSTSTEIARAIRMSPGGASSVLKKLVEVGYMTRDSEGKGSHPRYWLRGEGDEYEEIETEGDSKDVRIAEAARLLFDLQSIELVTFLEWVELTRGMMG